MSENTYKKHVYIFNILYIHNITHILHHTYKIQAIHILNTHLYLKHAKKYTPISQRPYGGVEKHRVKRKGGIWGLIGTAHKIITNPDFQGI